MCHKQKRSMFNAPGVEHLTFLTLSYGSESQFRKTANMLWKYSSIAISCVATGDPLISNRAYLGVAYNPCLEMNFKLENENFQPAIFSLLEGKNWSHFRRLTNIEHGPHGGDSSWTYKSAGSRVIFGLHIWKPPCFWQLQKPLGLSVFFYFQNHFMAC